MGSFSLFKVWSPQRKSKYFNLDVFKYTISNSVPFLLIKSGFCNFTFFPSHLLAETSGPKSQQAYETKAELIGKLEGLWSWEKHCLYGLVLSYNQVLWNSTNGRNCVASCFSLTLSWITARTLKTRTWGICHWPLQCPSECYWTGLDVEPSLENIPELPRPLHLAELLQRAQGLVGADCLSLCYVSVEMNF